MNERWGARPNLAEPRWCPPTPPGRGEHCYAELYAEGQVVWAWPIGLHPILLEAVPGDAPGLFVHGFGPRSIHHLAEVAKRVDAVRAHGEEAPLGLRRLARRIRDEGHGMRQEPLPTTLTDGEALYLSTVEIHRRHLPCRALQMDLPLPLVARPGQGEPAFVLPEVAWTDTFRAAYTRDVATSAP